MWSCVAQPSAAATCYFGPTPPAADEEAVRNCQAYMLFYSQRRLLEAREPAAAASERQTRSQAARRK